MRVYGVATYIYLFYILNVHTGNSVSPHYLTAFETDVLFTCSHVPHARYHIYIPSVQNYVRVFCFFLTSYQRFLMSRVGRSYIHGFVFVFVFFCRQKGSIFQNSSVRRTARDCVLSGRQCDRRQRRRRKKKHVFEFFIQLLMYNHIIRLV